MSPEDQSSRSEQPERCRRLDGLVRDEFVAGAEVEWRRRTGRPMTAGELAQIVRRYPGEI
jgi:hypothetical protein